MKKKSGKMILKIMCTATTVPIFLSSKCKNKEDFSKKFSTNINSAKGILNNKKITEQDLEANSLLAYKQDLNKIYDDYYKFVLLIESEQKNNKFGDATLLYLTDVLINSNNNLIELYESVKINKNNFLKNPIFSKYEENKNNKNFDFWNEIYSLIEDKSK